MGLGDSDSLFGRAATARPQRIAAVDLSLTLDEAVLKSSNRSECSSYRYMSRSVNGSPVVELSCCAASRSTKCLRG